MKKLLSVIMCVVMIAALSTTAFAAGSFENGSGGAYQQNSDEIKGSSGKEANIQVFGYVGEDAKIEPNEPDQPPTVTPSQTTVQVNVPVQILWASFATGGNAVVSPTYYIENITDNGASYDVTVKEFKAKTSAANTAVDSSLILKLCASGTGFNAVDREIFNGVDNVVGDMPSNDVPETAAFAPGNKWEFTIGGSYTGSKAVNYQPEYDLTLKFALR